MDQRDIYAKYRRTVFSPLTTAEIAVARVRVLQNSDSKAEALEFLQMLGIAEPITVALDDAA